MGSRKAAAERRREGRHRAKRRSDRLTLPRNSHGKKSRRSNPVVDFLNAVIAANQLLEQAHAQQAVRMLQAITRPRCARFT